MKLSHPGMNINLDYGDTRLSYCITGAISADSSSVSLGGEIVFAYNIASRKGGETYKYYTRVSKTAWYQGKFEDALSVVRRNVD